MNNFWQSLPKLFFALAPMEEVTDTVFRQVLLKTARPDVYFTEFVNCEGLLSSGRNKLISRLKFNPDEKPIVAQVWGIKPESFYKVAQDISEMGFDGIDINMGCPDKSVIKKGACSALIDNPKLAVGIIQATKKGAGTLPVSVKTRIGVKEIKTEGWVKFLLEQGIEALTVHGRTVKEMSKVPAHWDEIEKAVQVRDQLKINTLIIGNGDVGDYDDGIEKAKVFGVDGIMIGRGILKNPWAFAKVSYQPTQEELIKLLQYHIELFDKTWGTSKNFHILKKFFKIYVSGFPGAADWRAKLMSSSSISEAESIITQHIIQV